MAARGRGGIGGGAVGEQGDRLGLGGGLRGAVSLSGLLGLLRLLLPLLLLHQLPLNGGGAQHEANALRLQQHLGLRLGGGRQWLGADPRRRRGCWRTLRLGRGGALQRGGDRQWTGLLLQEACGVHIGVNLRREPQKSVTSHTLTDVFTTKQGSLPELQRCNFLSFLVHF